jgi:predicted GH43/DUF377 family glycosyl hydrolase
MPFVHKDALAFVYASAPTMILGWDADTARVTKLSLSDGPPEAEEYRGGSQGVPLDDGYLFIVHEVVVSAAKLQYLHRFVLLDPRLELTAASESFTFVSDPVEFCAGLARRGDDLVLSFGVSDAAAGLAIVPLDEARKLLRPFAKSGLPSTRARVSDPRQQ